MNAFPTILQPVSHEDVFIKVTPSYAVLKRALEIEIAGNNMTLEQLDIDVSHLSDGEKIEKISCPIALLTREYFKDCAVAYSSNDKLTTFIKCSCSNCQKYNAVYIVQSRFDIMRRYIQFQNNFILVDGSAGSLFYQTYQDDNAIFKVQAMKKEGVRDSWADKTINISVQKGSELYTKRIDVVDLSLKGIHGCLSSKEMLSDPMQQFYINRYGNSMSRYHAICFKPNVLTTKEYNLWKGFPIEAKSGSVIPFISFLYEAVGKEEGDHILDFFAHMIQKPEEKPRFCLVFKGAKGTGKNTIEEALGRDMLYGENYYRTSQTEQFFGKFNFHVAQNVLSVLQELKWDSSKNHDSIIKDMITETSRSIEQKYMDQVMLDNFSRIIITTNELWAVPASSKDERRYCVISFPDEKTESLEKKIQAYYAWKNESPIGAKQALMYFLLHRDLSAFSIDKAPQTKGLIEQLSYSLSGVDKFIYNALHNGYFGNINEKGNSGKNFGYLEVDKNLRIKRTALYGCFQFSFPKETNISSTKFHERVTELIGSSKISSNGLYVQCLDLKDSIELFEKATAVNVEADLVNWNIQSIVLE